MKIAIWGGIILLECIGLAGLSYSRKLTRKQFFLIVSFSVVLSGAFLGMSMHAGSDNSAVNEKEYIYMAASLIEKDCPEEAVAALGLVQDDGNETYGIAPLRGLAYNLCDAYQLSAVYLEEKKGEYEKQIYDCSMANQTTGPELKEAVIADTIEALGFSEDEKVRLEERAAQRFLSAGTLDEEAKENRTEFYEVLKSKVQSGNYQDAFQMAQTESKNGSAAGDVIVSQMYLMGYSHNLSDDDKEYDAILKEMTDNQAEMIRLRNSEDEKAYRSAKARYELASEKMHLEAAGRSWNYLKESMAGKTDIRYQLQMSYLAFELNDYEEAKKQLDSIFTEKKLEKEGKMGELCALLRTSYLLLESGNGNREFDAAYEQMMDSLYMNVFQESLNQTAFKAFVQEYLKELVGGIRIGEIDVSEFPEVHVKVNTSLEDTELTRKTIQITDTKERITEFEIENEENTDFSICYVLDVSGSMSGSKIENAKKAIRDSINSLDDSVEVSLVSFDNEAKIRCGMTSSKYAVTSMLEKLDADGGTNIAAGLEKACDTFENMDGKQIIILISDGMDGNEAGLSSALSKVNTCDAAVYTIGLTGCDENYLRNIADETEGSFVSASNEKQLKGIYQDIQRYMKTTYYVTYTAVDTETEHRYISIDLLNTQRAARQVYEKSFMAQLNNGMSGNAQSSDFFHENGGTEKQ